MVLQTHLKDEQFLKKSLMHRIDKNKNNDFANEESTVKLSKKRVDTRSLPVIILHAFFFQFYIHACETDRRP